MRRLILGIFVAVFGPVLLITSWPGLLWLEVYARVNGGKGNMLCAAFWYCVLVLAWALVAYRLVRGG